MDRTRPYSRPTCSLIAIAILASFVSAAGCSQHPYFAAPGGAAWQTPQTAGVEQTEARIAELNRRVQLLDDNNRQLHTRVAQSEQQAQVYRDELDLTRQQLADVTRQYEATSLAARNAESQVRGMQASTQMRGNATIGPNTNLSRLAGQLNLGGIPVLQEGNAVRILVPADQLFQPGTAQLLPQSSLALDPIASQLRSIFPRHRIGIEGFTDNAPIYGGAVANSHQLAAAQASAVLDVLVRRAGMSPNQLSTVAHGANRPRQSNDTAAGRAANRRIELVIHPETF